MGIPDATTNGVRAAIVFIAVAVGIAGLEYFESVLAPFALAVFLWLVIDAFARWLDRHIPGMPYWGALTLALIVIILASVGIIFVIADTVNGYAARSLLYERNLDAMLERGWRALSRYFDVGEAAPSIQDLFLSIDYGRYLRLTANSLQTIASSTFLVFLYVAFLFMAQSQWQTKMRRMFPKDDARKQVEGVLAGSGRAMAQYLRVQTVLGLLGAAPSYILFWAIGLDEPLFWAFVIFLVSYIPTLGPLLAQVLPVLFALVQPQFALFGGMGPTVSPLIGTLAVLIGGVAWQSIVGNVIQPRLQGDTLNLSAVVVLLSLALWGKVWGLTGMFLSAPLTVMIMIILAQYKSSRWLAVAMSGNGRPEDVIRVSQSDGKSAEQAGDKRELPPEADTKGNALKAATDTPDAP